MIESTPLPSRSAHVTLWIVPVTVQNEHIVMSRIQEPLTFFLFKRSKVVNDKPTPVLAGNNLVWAGATGLHVDRDKVAMECLDYDLNQQGKVF